MSLEMDVSTGPSNELGPAKPTPELSRSDERRVGLYRLPTSRGDRRQCRLEHDGASEEPLRTKLGGLLLPEPRS
jgi:hypothetical protein